MKKIISKIFILLILSSFSLGSEINDTYRFAATIFKYDKVHKNKIRNIVKKISKQFERITNKNVEVSFWDNSKGLVNSYIKHKDYDSIVLYTNEYLENKKILKDNSQFFFSFDYKKEFKEYVLVANRKSGINSIKDLKNKTYVDFNKSDNVYSQWLDYLCLKNTKKSYKKLIKKEKKVSKDSTLILEVYFNKADFTVVRKNVYDDMITLNPAIVKRLKIIKRSKPVFLYGIGMFNKSSSKKMVDIFDKNVLNGTFNKEYKYLLRTMGESKMVRIYPKDIKDLEKFYDEYLQLKSKYK